MNGEKNGGRKKHSKTQARSKTVICPECGATITRYSRCNICVSREKRRKIAAELEK